MKLVPAPLLALALLAGGCAGPQGPVPVLADARTDVADAFASRGEAGRAAQHRSLRPARPDTGALVADAGEAPRHRRGGDRHGGRGRQLAHRDRARHGLGLAPARLSPAGGRDLRLPARLLHHRRPGGAGPPAGRAVRRRAAATRSSSSPRRRPGTARTASGPTSTSCWPRPSGAPGLRPPPRAGGRGRPLRRLPPHPLLAGPPAAGGDRAARRALPRRGAVQGLARRRTGRRARAGWCWSPTRPSPPPRRWPPACRAPSPSPRCRRPRAGLEGAARAARLVSPEVTARAHGDRRERRGAAAAAAGRPPPARSARRPADAPAPSASTSTSPTAPTAARTATSR